MISHAMMNNTNDYTPHQRIEFDFKCNKWTMIIVMDYNQKRDEK